jgi:small subunit ribosomal protein S9
MSSKAIFAVGRRKTSIARVKLTPGEGEIKINGRTVSEYFPVPRLAGKAVSGLTLVGAQDKFNFNINVAGGGVSSQAGAVRMGIARALQRNTPDFRAHLKKAGFLTRDSRMVERKKYGLRKARRGTQFSKR